MLILALTTDKLQLVTSAARTVDVHASFMDLASGTVTPGKQNTAITTAVTTDIVAAPGASTQRNVKTLHIRNKDTTALDVTVQYNQNGTIYELHKATLDTQQSLEYIEGVGFFVLLPSLSAAQLLTGVEGDDSQRIFQSSMPVHNFAAVGGFLLISGTAYYVYVGRLAKGLTIKFVEFHVVTVGAGTQVVEVGLFSTPSAPNKSAQTLTKIVATGTVDSLTVGATVKRNTTSFAQNVDAGTHLWAAIRTAMATTQPTTYGLEADMLQGHVLTTTGGGALTALTTAAGTIPSINTVAIVPHLTVTLD